MTWNPRVGLTILECDLKLLRNTKLALKIGTQLRQKQLDRETYEIFLGAFNFYVTNTKR